MFTRKVSLIGLVGSLTVFGFLSDVFASGCRHDQELLESITKAMKAEGYTCVRAPVSVSADATDRRSKILRIIEKATSENADNFEFHFYETEFERDAIDVTYVEEIRCLATKKELGGITHEGPFEVERLISSTVRVKGVVGLTGVCRKLNALAINETRSFDRLPN